MHVNGVLIAGQSNYGRTGNVIEWVASEASHQALPARSGRSGYRGSCTALGGEKRKERRLCAICPGRRLQNRASSLRRGEPATSLRTGVTGNVGGPSLIDDVLCAGYVIPKSRWPARLAI